MCSLHVAPHASAKQRETEARGSRSVVAHDCMKTSVASDSTTVSPPPSSPYVAMAMALVPRAALLRAARVASRKPEALRPTASASSCVHSQVAHRGASLGARVRTARGHMPQRQRTSAAAAGWLTRRGPHATAPIHPAGAQRPARLLAVPPAPLGVPRTLRMTRLCAGAPRGSAGDTGAGSGNGAMPCPWTPLTTLDDAERRRVLRAACTAHGGAPLMRSHPRRRPAVTRRAVARAHRRDIGAGGAGGAQSAPDRVAVRRGARRCGAWPAARLRECARWRAGGLTLDLT